MRILKRARKVTRAWWRELGDKPQTKTDPTPDARVLADFVDELTAAVQASDQTQIERLAESYKKFSRAVHEAVTPEIRGRAGIPLAYGSGTQSRQFMIDLLPHVQSFLAEHDRNTTLSVLDVGSGTGHGAELLASLYASKELGYQLKVTSLDINDYHRTYLSFACPHLVFRKDNVFSHKKTYDIVIASHVVEHVKDTLSFCRGLQERARGVVFLTGPFEEPKDKLTKGHLHSLGHDFLDALAPQETHIIESRAWGNFLTPPYKMFMVRLDGLAR